MAGTSDVPILYRSFLQSGANFAKHTGTKLTAALYGMLTMPERGEVMEDVRLGDSAILFVSPEQVRNQSFIQTIRQ